MMDDETISKPPISLVDLPEEVLLYLLDDQTGERRREWHRSLCRLEQVCTKFRLAVALAFEDGEHLCLPERAAKRRITRALAQPVRPDGLQPMRPYDRGTSEPYRRVLQLLERGLLTRGVLHNVPVHAVESSGWQLAYSAPYKHRTRDSDLDKVPMDARYVLAAAVKVNKKHDIWQNSSSWWQRVTGTSSSSASSSPSPSPSSAPSFALLAWGRREVVMRVTHDQEFEGFETSTDNADEDVYWYRWPNHSFGFSSDPALWLWAADAAIAQIGPGNERASEDRLSWNLDTLSTGGWRAGIAIDLGASNEWEKRLYYRL